MTTVTRTLVPEDRRLAVTAELFGMRFPTRIEPVVFAFAERLSKDYRGGYPLSCQWCTARCGHGALPGQGKR
jgi:hypothetical protein